MNWIYGGDIGKNDVLIPTVLGPLDRGIVLSMSNTNPPQNSPEVMMTITPPSGHEDVLVRLGSPKSVFRNFAPSFSSTSVGSTLNPLTLTSGETIQYRSARQFRCAKAGIIRDALVVSLCPPLEVTRLSERVFQGSKFESISR